MKRKVFPTIFKFSKPFRWTFINLFICVFFTSFIAMFYPYIFGLLVDEVFNHKNMNYFLTIILIYGGIFICEQLLHLTLNTSWAYLMTRYIFDIRKTIFKKILSLKSSRLKAMKSGELLSLINKDAEEFMNLIHWNIFYTFANSIRLLTALAFVFFINVKLALLMLIVVPIAVFIALRFGMAAKKWLSSYRTHYGEYINWVFEILGGLRDIKLLSAERNVTRSMLGLLSKLISTRSRTVMLEFASTRAVSFISLLSDLSLYTISALFIVSGELTIGGFIACIDYFGRASSLLKNLSGANTRLQNNLVSINRVIDILDEEDEGKEGEKLTERITKVKFKGLSFQYDQQVNLLHNINLNVNYNETLAIVGHSGSGKSTLFDLLLRFEEPNSGAIYVNNKDINDYSIASLRDRVGIVHQQAIVFDGTIRDNLLLANTKASEQQLWDACEQAYLAHFIRELPEGMDTLLGSEGRELSGGQKQRLFIARILLSNPDVLLLDEATSALDLEAESAILQSLNEIKRNRITIIIAHRLDSITNADKIAVISNGTIVACDKHEVLMEQCREYQELYNNKINVPIGDYDEEVQVVG